MCWKIKKNKDAARKTWRVVQGLLRKKQMEQKAVLKLMTLAYARYRVLRISWEYNQLRGNAGQQVIQVNQDSRRALDDDLARIIVKKVWKPPGKIANGTGMLS